MAFQLGDYIALLTQLADQGYRLLPIEAYFDGAPGPSVFLRHDCDRQLFRSVAMAEAEQEVGAVASYYVRSSRRGSFPAATIARIKNAGHRVGFHYETLSRSSGDIAAAVTRFERELHTLRQLAEVTTAAAHGSPLSRHCNRDIWREATPRQFNLVGEAYEDVDFQRVLYVSDTGGLFGGEDNLRDRVAGISLPGPLAPWQLAERLSPTRYPRVILSCHPERWAVTKLGRLEASALDWGKNHLKRLAARLRGAA